MSYQFKFKSWLFNQLPANFRDRDSYKDANDKGLLQRYLENLGTEYDDEMVDFIHNFCNIFNLDVTDAKFLPLLGFLLGSPPNITSNNTDYRRFLKHIVSIYKVKGTPKSYQLLFNTLGLGVVVYEYPKQPQITYDAGFNYDEHNLYDIPCEPCPTYSLFYFDLNDDCATPVINSVPDSLLNQIKAIVCLLQPIDCKLLDLSHNINLCDTYAITGDNELTFDHQVPASYDDNLDYDASLDYDSFVTSSTLTVYF